MSFERLRGLRALVEDVVEHGSTAVQSVHLALAARPFAVAEAIPPLATPARAAHAVYDLYVSGIYAGVRIGNRVVGKVLAVTLDVVEARGDE
jgi:hypothetical protein